MGLGGKVALLTGIDSALGVATTADVAAAAHFRVSDEALSITGALLPVDAGRSLPTF